MSQKYIKSQNKNSHSEAFGKYYATAVYDSNFVGTEELAEFIQRQASVKKSDIKAVLQELGEALKHFFEMGQKVRLDGIGIFKVGFSSIGVNKLEDCSAATITTRRVLFQPETTRVVVGQEKKEDGSVKQKYVNAITLLKDVIFEETHDNAMNTSSSGSLTPNPDQGGSLTPDPSPQGEGSQSDTPRLTISRSGTGTSSVTVGGNAVNSGAEIAADTEVAISVTPAEGQTPTATLNGSSVTLTESNGTYTGTFTMPSANATLVINSGSNGSQPDDN